MQNFPAFMVDIETFATTADAVIRSIGAVAFRPLTGQTEPDYFYCNLLTVTQGRRRRDPETVKWWDEQSDEARAAFHNPQYPQIALIDGLYLLNEWINQYAKGGEMWSHNFDKNILHHAFREHDMKPAWHFRGERDLRTLVALGTAMGIDPHVDRVGEHHNAVDDCLTQVAYTSKIYMGIAARGA